MDGENDIEVLEVNEASRERLKVFEWCLFRS